MNLRIMLLAASLASVICHNSLGAEPDYDSPEDALLHDMEIMDADVRNSALAGYKRRFDLSDDEFSDRLVKMATVTTNGHNAWLRGFTICAICDFGTTNALDFLENEAIHGSSSAGIKGYGIITDFDDRFFSLAERILADKSIENAGRRDSTYRVFKSLISYSQMRGKEIKMNTRTMAREALFRHSISDSYHRVLIDMILGKHDFEEVSYKNSSARLRIARIACDDPDSSDYARGYFGGVLEQMEREAAATNAVSITRTKNEQQHKPTSNLDPKAEQGADGEGVPATNGKSQYWRIILSFPTILVVLLLVAAGVRHKHKNRKGMVS